MNPGRRSRGIRVAAALCCALLVAACTSPTARPRASETPSTPAVTTTHTGAPITSAPASSTAPPAPADWITYHFDAARSGDYPSMPVITRAPHLVATVRLDAPVYASPLVIGGLVIVATERDSVYALTTAGRIVWRRQLGAPAPRAALPCGNIDPSGITGTPVYDAGTGLVYVVAEHADPVRHDAVALDARTGTVAWTRALPLSGTSQDAMQQRSALTITAGRVWIAFGGRAGDCGQYRGTLVGIPLDGAGAAITFTVPTAREGGIWSPPGPSVDAQGRLYVPVGNGAAGPGDRYDYSDSVLGITAGGTLFTSFSPTTWASDNAADLDLGSQGPTLVGPWVFAAGKSGTAYVLRLGRLGGIGGQVSQAQLCASFGGTAVVGEAVYVPCTDGLRAVVVDSAGRLHVRWHAAASITGSPVVAGGRVWSLDVSAGVLFGLSPASGASLSRVAVGPVSRFATPAVYGSDLFVPTLAGLAIVAT